MRRAWPCRRGDHADIAVGRRHPGFVHLQRSALEQAVALLRDAVVAHPGIRATGIALLWRCRGRGRSTKPVRTASRSAGFRARLPEAVGRSGPSEVAGRGRGPVGFHVGLILPWCTAQVRAHPSETEGWMRGIAGFGEPLAAAGPMQEQSAAMAVMNTVARRIGTYRDDRAGLAHARLSIIDLASGQQPLANEDETRWLSSTARSTSVELGAAPGLRPPLPDPQRHRGHRPRVGAVGDRGLPPLQRPMGNRAMGRNHRGRLVLARDPYRRPAAVYRGRGRPARPSPAS